MGYHSYQPGILGAFIVLDLAVQILAILGNCLVLMAVINVKIGLVGFRRFLISLLGNNIFLCVSQVFIAIYLELDSTIDRQHSCVGTFLDSVKLFAVFAALFNLCGMTLDHLIGITRPLKYDYLMNTKMAKMAPFLIWIFAFIFGFIDIPIAALVYYMYSYRPVAAGASYLSLLEALMNSTNSAGFAGDSDNLQTEANLIRKAIIRTTTIGTPVAFVFSPLGNPPPLLINDVTALRRVTSRVNNIISTVKQTEPPVLLPSDLSDAMDDLKQLGNIDVGLLQEETDWCLISHSYKLYWVQWFRLVCTVVVFAFLVICYGRIFGEIRKNNKMLSSADLNRRMSYNNKAAVNHTANNNNNNNGTSLAMSNFGNSNSSGITNGGQHGAIAVASPSHCRRQSSLMQRRSSRKFVMTTLSLLSAFAICWLPFIVLEIAVSPDQLVAPTPNDTTVTSPELLLVTAINDEESSTATSRLHLLQHLFNSLFLSYPLLDALVCVTRVCTVRRYIRLMLLLPFKCRPPSSSNFAAGSLAGPDSTTLITMTDLATQKVPLHQSGSGDASGSNPSLNTTACGTPTVKVPPHGSFSSSIKAACNNGNPRLARTQSVERAKANGFIIGVTWEQVPMNDEKL